MNKVRLVTYNIDGLPDKLNLGDLPWCLKPIAWVYKKIKGTTEIAINDNTDRAENMRQIGEYLKSLNADIIAVQEDFNYHDELMSGLGVDYLGTTHTGDISLKNLFSKTEWRPFPRFKADGLNLIRNLDTTCVFGEDIVRWKKSNGYVGHANDKLTHKGFRHYVTSVGDYSPLIDLYIVHMDADFYNPETCPDVSKDVKARKSQIQQLLEYIQKNDTGNPTIIIGDTNSTDKYEWDRENIQLLKDAGFIEAEADKQDVDRFFYKGNIKVLNAEYDDVWLSDHRPLIVDLELI